MGMAAGTAGASGAAPARGWEGASAQAAYRADIDGLRALAVLAVVIGHFWPQWLPGGYVGVDVFFVISGYLITQILLRELQQGRFRVRAFYARRARRLFPALFTVLAATAVLGLWVLLPTDLLALQRTLLATLAFSANVLLWRESANYFDATEALDNPLVHLWSLGVEEQFYLFFPWLLVAVLALAARRAQDPRRLLRPLLWLLLVANLLVAGWVNTWNTNAAFYLSPLRAWEFLAGSLAALHAPWRLRPRWLVPALWRAGRQALALTSLAVLLLCMGLYSAYTAFPGWAALPPVLATAWLLHSGGGHAVGRWLQSPPLVGVGLVSYSLYLWHWPLLVLWRHQQALAPSALSLVALLLVAFVLAALTWRFVEQPWRRPAALRPRAGAAWLGAAVALLLGLGVYGVLQRGHPGRVPAQVLALDRARSTPVPWQECADRAPERGCVLGRPQAAPDVLLWGDSHLLGWLPALDRAMADAQRSARVSAHLACAPLLAVDNTRKRECAPASRAVWAHLQAHPEIRTVVIAGYWGHYFRERSPSRSQTAGGQRLEGLAAAGHGLHETLARLVASGREVVLIGPVPTYAQNVPQSLALHAWRGRALAPVTATQQAQRQALFWQAAERWRGQPQLRLLDPIAWFCPSECARQAQGQALYRDEQHINAWGALWAAPALARSLGIAAAPVQP